MPTTPRLTRRKLLRSTAATAAVAAAGTPEKTEAAPLALGANLYELRNSPWHVRSVNWLDVVEAIPRNENEWPEFVRVHKRSGHRTIHVYILDAGKNQTGRVLQQSGLVEFRQALGDELHRGGGLVGKMVP